LAVTLMLLSFCGFVVNTSKSMTAGARRFDYLGLHFDLDAWVIVVQKKSVDKRVGAIDRLLDRKCWPSGSLRPVVDTRIGLLNFMEVVVHPLRPFKHWLVGIRRAVNRSAVFTFSETHRELLRTIQMLALSRNQAPIWDRCEELAKVHDHGVATDACEAGFGGWGRTVAGEVVYFHGLWADLSGLPRELIISDKELLAHAMAVECLVPEVAPGARAVDYLIDNQNAQSWVNHLRCQMSESNPASQLRFHFLRCYMAMC
jgi:hypothetical protein